jgi:predicted nucleic acid-binding Zn ribbon protein
MKDIIELNTVIKSIVKQKKWDDLFVCSRIIEVWSQILDGKLVTKVKVKKFEKGVLYLETESSAWRTELQLRKKQIINKINYLIKNDSVLDMIIK